ncbi:hypothetical protein GQ53DRAFT_876394 [Thozetella sp. PMI_491]|nr:hypothetical protein GQ53DRAFT_876394 [Thozetella sp. PMI_491]
MGPALTFLAPLALGLSLISSAAGQDAPLFVQGALDGTSVNDYSYNSGGFIQLAGFNITVPKNMLVQMPNAFVPWKNFSEDSSSMIGYETNVIGNFINGVPIAAQIFTFELFEGLASGFIESIEPENGTMKIAQGPILRINDPNAVFSVGYSEAPFFTADDQSPSITSFSGFPMCIPRNASDPLCPASNRPFRGSGTFAAPDPLSMAPFLPGDFITWQGIRRGAEVIAFNIVAQNVQITTLQTLAYARIEVALIGVDNFNGNTEIAESRIRGFVSNRAATVAIYAIDIDPCTGETKDRIVAAVGLRGGERNEFRYETDILRGYAREYRVVTEIDGIPRTRTTKNGLLAGTYSSPVNPWIHAEQLIPGTPPPPNDFSQMPWLTEGVGVDENGNLWGPLDPFPQTGILVDPPVCANVSAASFRGGRVNTDWAPSCKSYPLLFASVITPKRRSSYFRMSTI